MPPAAQQKTPFAQSVWDTSALIFFGLSAFFLPVFFPLGAVMILVSRRWTWTEKLVAVLLPVACLAFGGFFALFTDAGRILMMFAIVVPAISAFYLAFRMGVRSPKFEENAIREPISS